MGEASGHAGGLGFQRHDVAFQQVVGEFVEVTTICRRFHAMEVEVHFAEGQLAHGGDGAEVVFRGHHLLK